MRVVHFGYADDLPGAARASFRLHRELVALGVDSWMVVAARSSGDERVLGPEGLGRVLARAASRADAVLTRRLTGRRPERSAAIVGSGRVRAVRALEPDVVQLHWLGGGLVRPPGLAALRGLPVVWRLADEWTFRGTAHYDPGPPDALERWATSRKGRALRRLDDLTIVTPTRWLASAAAASDVLRGRRVEVIPTGVDLDRWHPGDREEARRRLDLPLDVPLVAFGATGGGTNPRKGFDLLVAAARLVRDDARFATFGGSAALPDDLRGRAHDLGRIDDEELLTLAYRASDVFVAPSRQENLPNTGIEALACGTPVVGFAVGGMPELVEHGVSGWLAGPFDVADLAAGIDWALDAGARDAARRRAAARFDQRATAAAYRSLYESLR